MTRASPFMSLLLRSAPPTSDGARMDHDYNEQRDHCQWPVQTDPRVSAIGLNPGGSRGDHRHYAASACGWRSTATASASTSSAAVLQQPQAVPQPVRALSSARSAQPRSEEHTSELQSLMRISYAVFCLKQKHTTPTR